ncbi:unnamed protein product, partial [Urochloa humidicola]
RQRAKRWVEAAAATLATGEGSAATGCAARLRAGARHAWRAAGKADGPGSVLPASRRGKAVGVVGAGLPPRRPSFLSPSSSSRHAWSRRRCTHEVRLPLQVAAAEAGAPAASVAAAPYLAVAPPLPRPAKASSATAGQADRRPVRLVLKRSSRGKRSPRIRERRAEIAATQGEASGGVAVVRCASLEHVPSLLAPAHTAPPCLLSTAWPQQAMVA